jgi:DNA-binding beta-propeller fold protein YncE
MRQAILDRGLRRLRLPALCGVLAALAAVAPAARADLADPLFSFYASEEKEGKAHAPYPAPGSGFEGPCGLAVDSLGDFYVADYYHHSVDAFESSRKFLGQLFEEDPLDGPCGLAVGVGGALYVNNFHRNVVRFTPSSFPLASFTPYGAGTVIDSEHPTGVAVDAASGNVYVDDRTHVAVYEPSGAPVEVGGEPLRIGLGSLEDGYGVAVSGFPATAGYVYVPDAATDTVKVYDPAVDTLNPVAEIDGHEVPGGGFVSLRDAAIAVAKQSGRIYVADDLQPEYYERPEAAIYAFTASGVYAGRLKYNVVNARPPGLAVDSSCAEHSPPLSEETTPTCEEFNPANGNVYVTTGNGEEASVYAYASNALTMSEFKAPQSLAPSGGPGASATFGTTAGATGLVSSAAAQSSPPRSARALRAQRRRARHRRRAGHRRLSTRHRQAEHRRLATGGGR